MELLQVHVRFVPRSRLIQQKLDRNQFWGDEWPVQMSCQEVQSISDFWRVLEERLLRGLPQARQDLRGHEITAFKSFFISLLEYLERKRKFDTLQAEYQRAMENCREKKKASENADIYRDAIGASVISTANSFADFLKSNGTQLKFDDLTKHTRAYRSRQPLGIRQRTHASPETLQKIPKNSRRCVK